MHLMKEGATLAYSHGFNIVEEGMQIRKDITVIMCAPKCPGSEVREEYKRGFGVPTLIAVHPENDPNGFGLAQAKAYAVATGGHRAGVLKSSFVAEVKSDLMGEQTILCGLLQTGSILCFDKMVEKGIEPAYASKLIQYGWETITEALKHGGITNMMDRLNNPSKIEAFELAEELKDILFYNSETNKEWEEYNKSLREYNNILNWVWDEINDINHYDSRIEYYEKIYISYLELAENNNSVAHTFFTKAYKDISLNDIDRDIVDKIINTPIIVENEQTI
jgi:ketol-acid reductoisomerase